MKTLSTLCIADALGCSRQAVLQRARSERWPAKQQGKSLEWIPSGLPSEIVAQVARSPAAAVETQERAEFRRCRDKDRSLAQQRAALLSLYRQSGISATAFVSAFNAGHVSAPLRESLGKISVPTFYRWLDAWKESRIDGLVPQYYARAQGSELLTELVKTYLEHFYLDPRKPSARSAWDRTSELLPNVPSYQTALRYLKSLPKPYVDARRLGRSKFEAANFAYIERDPDLYLPMDQLVSDHHCIDILVERDGQLFRPWITIVQDFRSAKIVGFCPTVSPSSLSIVLAFYIAVKRFGAAKLIHIDNGKDYRSIMLRGQDKRIITLNKDGIPESEMVHLAGAFSVFAEDVTYAMPYHGQSKGRTERFFGTLAERFSKANTTYLGSNTVTRPEDAALFWRAINKQAKRNDVITWEAFVPELARWIDWYNSSWRGEGKGLEGKTPDEVFAELAPPPRTVDDESLALAFSRSEERVVFENGVRMDGVSFWSDDLIPYIGQRVFVRRQILAPSEVIVNDLRGGVIAKAKANWFKETGDLAEDNARVKSARKKVLELVKNTRRAMPDSLGSLPKTAALELEDKQLAAGGEHDPVEPVRSFHDDGRGAAFIDLLTEA